MAINLCHELLVTMIETGITLTALMEVKYAPNPKKHDKNITHQ